MDQGTTSISESRDLPLFDDLYDAAVVEVAVKTKWGTEKPKRVEDVTEKDPNTQKPKTVKRFVYEVVQPCGRLLMQHLPDGDGLWLKLWRDMLWNIPRGIHKTRLPFQQRANGNPCSEGANAWRELLSHQKAAGKGNVRTWEVASALFLGAQAFNAESVPFRGRTDQTLVLHFWPLVSPIFVPGFVDDEGKTFIGKRNNEDKDLHFVLAISEVADLKEFCRLYPRIKGTVESLSWLGRGARPARWGLNTSRP